MLRQASERQIAATQIAHRRADGIRPEEEVELGVEWMSQEEFDDYFLSPNLRCQAPQTCLILIGRCTNGELLTKVLRELLLKLQGGLIIDAVLRRYEAKGFAQVVLGQPLHANE